MPSSMCFVIRCGSLCKEVKWGFVERVRLHAHSTPGFDGQSKRANELILNSGFSHLEFAKDPTKKSIACVGVDDGIDFGFLECRVSRFKIALVLETPELSAGAIESVRDLHSRLDLILTHNAELLHEFPDKAKRLWLGGSYLRGSDSLYCRSKKSEISLSASRKNFLEGHKLRHEIVEKFRSRGLKVMGEGYRPYRSPKRPYGKFMYSVVVENSRAENYFTEKLVHCLLFRCIPVYWGSLTLPPEFDESGIVRFGSLEELEQIWPTLTPENYQNLGGQVLANQRAALKYCSTELSVQRSIADFFELSELREIGVEDYFGNVEEVLDGRAPFLPFSRAKFIPPVAHRLPLFTRTWSYHFRKILRPFVDWLRRR